MKKNPVFDQVEAMCLMWYECKSCGTNERIWNSRPRVTPFVINCECGGEMNHVHWHLDEFAPNHTPKKGDRIFVDCSKETMEKHWKKVIDKNWNHPEYPISKRHETKEKALVSFMSSWEFGQPTVIKID